MREGVTKERPWRGARHLVESVGGEGDDWVGGGGQRVSLTLRGD